MKTVSIGVMSLSPIVLGTDYYGSILSDKEAFRMYDEYTDRGGNVIDTARLYVDGKSEQLLGQWLKASGRSRVIISTKGAHPSLDTMHISRLSMEELRSDTENSLHALQTDYIDLYWLHRDDTAIAAGEIIERLNVLIKEGKMRYIGASNWKAERIREANDYAKQHGLMGFCTSQIKWSVAKSNPAYVDDPTLVEMDQKEMDFYRINRFPVFAYAPQAKGIFSKLAAGVPLSDKAKERYWCDENRRRYELLQKLAAEHHTSVSAVVLSYITSAPFPALAIVGCKNPQQLDDSLLAMDCHLSPEEWAKLSE